ncbi:astacin [Necator americanus]|uniref:Metalloendopeptidase n=1 Tax=Necator americanus TaxID=51031 RepID=W2T339_NECAM|nr:astacin [Necator americanus]ETN75979.1 astacin [Necator americanus]
MYAHHEQIQYLICHTQKRSIVNKALNYLRSRTCIKFVESQVAPNRIRVFNGAGCWSYVGMMGGVQDLSLGTGCSQVGIAAHEFTHALGVYHMQMRDDRDNYVMVDLTNVPINVKLLLQHVQMEGSRIPITVRPAFARTDTEELCAVTGWDNLIKVKEMTARTPWKSSTSYGITWIVNCNKVECHEDKKYRMPKAFVV